MGILGTHKPGLGGVFEDGSRNGVLGYALGPGRPMAPPYVLGGTAEGPKTPDTVDLAANTRRGDQRPRAAPPLQTLSARNRSYLDRYYGPVANLARGYGVDPALVLGMGFESGYASLGTYKKTGDAFGMTGGGTAHMTRASTPEENARQLFDAYGEQIRGSGSDVERFIHGIQGEDPSGRPVRGWRRFNTVGDRKPGRENYRYKLRTNIHDLIRDVPRYLQPASEAEPTWEDS